MLNNKSDGVLLVVDRYIEISDFEKLNLINRNILEKCEEKSVDNWLMAAIIGCIEGNIQMCLEKKSWFSWYGVHNLSFVSNSSRSNYTFLSIYNFVKSNNTLYNFITKYFNLWHSKEQAVFTYDEYHKTELNKNFQNLLKLINNDIELAVKCSDQEAVNQYRSFKDRLSSPFINSINVTSQDFFIDKKLSLV